jgi:hypothetical protein
LRSVNTTACVNERSFCAIEKCCCASQGGGVAFEALITRPVQFCTWNLDIHVCAEEVERYVKDNRSGTTAQRDI